MTKTHMMTETNAAALNMAMNTALANAYALIQDVQAKVDAMNKIFNEGGDINWGHVGDMNYINVQLLNIIDPE